MRRGGRARTARISGGPPDAAAPLLLLSRPPHGSARNVRCRSRTTRERGRVGRCRRARGSGRPWGFALSCPRSPPLSSFRGRAMLLGRRIVSRFVAAAAAWRRGEVNAVSCLLLGGFALGLLLLGCREGIVTVSCENDCGASRTSRWIAEWIRSGSPSLAGSSRGTAHRDEVLRGCDVLCVITASDGKPIKTIWCWFCAELLPILVPGSKADPRGARVHTCPPHD